MRAGKTRYSVVDKLLEQMPKEKLLGVVLNRTEEQPDESPTTTSTVTTTANERRLKFRRHRKTRRGGSDRQLRVLRLNGRTILLILRRGVFDLRRDHRCRVPARRHWKARRMSWSLETGYMKAAVACFFCLAAFYLFDLYDFLVMHDRRELVLRLVQALGLAWIALAFSFYTFPTLMLGRGISLIALPLALGLMVLWRISIHWFLGHPDFGERILIVGSGNLAVEVAREVLNRPGCGLSHRRVCRH